LPTELFLSVIIAIAQGEHTTYSMLQNKGKTVNGFAGKFDLQFIDQPKRIADFQHV